MVDKLKLFTLEYKFEVCFYCKFMLEQISVIEQHKSSAWHKSLGLRIIKILHKILIVVVVCDEQIHTKSPSFKIVSTLLEGQNCEDISCP